MCKKLLTVTKSYSIRVRIAKNSSNLSIMHGKAKLEEKQAVFGVVGVANNVKVELSV